MPTIFTLFIALAGGILPALLWLWFWLKEDKRRPEPRGLIILAFIAGMIAVPFVIPIEKMALTVTGGNTTTLTLVLWATAEELMKYGVALFLILRRKVVHEPIGTMMYMITVALGFAALENTLFLLNPNLGILEGILTGSLRFLGASLLHVLASSAVGVALAFSFYKNIHVKRMFVTIGLMLAILLHSLFNFFIMTSNGENTLFVFLFVWFGIVLLLLFFERVKHIKKLKQNNLYG